MSDAPPPVPGRNPLTWPKVIGTLSIVFSLFSVLGSVMVFLMGPLLRLQMRMEATYREVSLDSLETYLQQWNWYFITGGISSLVQAVGLLVGGILVIKLKKLCRPVLIFSATIGVLYAIFVLVMVFSTSMIEDQIGAMYEAESPEALGGRVGGYVGGALGSVISMAYPVFVIVWFLRKKIGADIEQHFTD